MSAVSMKVGDKFALIEVDEHLEECLVEGEISSISPFHADVDFGDYVMRYKRSDVSAGSYFHLDFWCAPNVAGTMVEAYHLLGAMAA